MCRHESARVGREVEYPGYRMDKKKKMGCRKHDMRVRALKLGKGEQVRKDEMYLAVYTFFLRIIFYSNENGERHELYNTMPFRRAGLHLLHYCPF